MIKALLVLFGLATAGCGALCACGNIHVPPTTYKAYPPMSTGSALAVPSPTPTGALVTTIDYTMNHKTFNLPNGSLINVVLNSTYWNFADGMYNNVLQQTSSQTSPCPIGTSFPGTGCGVVSRQFRAVNTGSTAITASRTSCGEAMGCSADQASFSVTIVIY